MNAVHRTIAAGSYKPKVTAYYGNWRIYGSYKYYPHIPADKESSFSCSDAWNPSSPVTGARNWGITNDIASKVNRVNHGFATINY